MFTFPLCQFASSGSVYIKSIQQVQITIPTGATSATATINSVNTSLAVAFYNGTNTTVANVFTGSAYFLARVELTNATTVTAYRFSSSSTDTVTVCATVVEFTAACVQSAQAGTLTLSNSTNPSATITSVDTTRSVVVWLGTISNSTSSSSAYGTGLTLTNATTVTGAGAMSFTFIVTGYAVIQFQTGIISTLEQRSPGYNDNNLTETDTLSTSVDTTRSILMYGGLIPPNTALPGGFAGLSLTGSTSVNIIRKNSTSGARAYYYTVVQFAPGVLRSLQRGIISFGSTDTVKTATTNPVSLASAFVNWNCGEFNGSSSQQNVTMHTLALTNTTTVTSTQAAAGGSQTANHEWELVEFS